MKRLSTSLVALIAASFFAGSAGATDIYDARNDALADPVQAQVDRTGPYVGVLGGYGWADSDFSGRVEDWGNDPKWIGPHRFDPDGYLAGGVAGYNYEFGNMLVGLEGEVGYMKLDGAGIIPSSTPKYHQDLTFKDGLYAVLGGRIGVTADRTMFYGKAGWAYFDGAASQKTTKPGFTTNESDAFTGWAYGGGVEYMISDNIDLRIEYLHFDFGEQTGDQTSNTTGHVFEYDTDLEMDAIKAGLNYRF